MYVYIAYIYVCVYMYIWREGEKRGGEIFHLPAHSSNAYSINGWTGPAAKNFTLISHAGGRNISPSAIILCLPKTQYQRVRSEAEESEMKHILGYGCKNFGWWSNPLRDTAPLSVSSRDEVLVILGTSSNHVLTIAPALHNISVFNLLSDSFISVSI